MILELEIPKVHNNELSQDKLLEFMTSSNAIFSIKSLKTNRKFTFRLSAKKNQINDNPDFLFVSVLTGSDNTSNYTYIGYLKPVTAQYVYLTHPQIRTETKWQFFYGDKSKIGKDSLCVTTFEWIMNKLTYERKMDDVLIWHEGVCCRCGRKLTAEKSSDNGIGDYCAKMKAKSNLK